jgi:hypothetical protein
LFDPGEYREMALFLGSAIAGSRKVADHLMIQEIRSLLGWSGTL